MTQNCANVLDKLTQSPVKVKKETLDEGITERLSNAENFLQLTSSKSDIYVRLKEIENKILYLESISPEYNNFLMVRRCRFTFSINKFKIHILVAKTIECQRTGSKLGKNNEADAFRS